MYLYKDDLVRYFKNMSKNILPEGIINSITFEIENGARYVLVDSSIEICVKFNDHNIMSFKVTDFLGNCSGKCIHDIGIRYVDYEDPEDFDEEEIWFGGYDEVEPFLGEIFCILIKIVMVFYKKGFISLTDSERESRFWLYMDCIKKFFGDSLNIIDTMTADGDSEMKLLTILNNK